MSSRQGGTDPTAGPTGLDEAVRLQRDLYLVWREAAAAGQSGLALTARGYLPRAALRRIRERTSAAMGESAAPEKDADVAESEDARLFFVRRLLERLGLLRLTTDEAQAARLVAAERETLERYLSLALAERVRIGVRLWVAGGWWPDTVDAAIAPPRVMVPAPPRIAVARRRLLEDLLELAPGEALAVPSAAGAALASNRRARTGRSRGHSAAGAAEGTAGEAATRRVALLGPLAWLGVAALARDGRTARAAAGIGALRHEPLELPERHGRVVLQADFSIVAYPPLTAPALLVLDGCAREVALDATARYRLTAEAFARAHDRGWTAADVAERLKALAGVPLPQNVRATLDDWARNAEKLRLTPGATILTVRDAKLLDALLADPSGAVWVARRLSPLHALLAPETGQSVRAWLLRKGELPAMRT